MSMIGKEQQAANLKKGKQFKIIVDGGEVYLVTVDSFEDVFEISRDVIKGFEFLDILDPFIFDNHKAVVCALFQVYQDLSTEYIEKEYYKKRAAGNQKYFTGEEIATEKLKLKFDLD